MANYEPTELIVQMKSLPEQKPDQLTHQKFGKVLQKHRAI